MLRHLPEIGLQLFYRELLSGDDFIQLLNGVFMVHQLDLNVGYPFFHGCSLPGRGLRVLQIKIDLSPRR
jgi:hypothetical protein